MIRRILGRTDAVEQGKEYSGGPGQPTKTIRRWKGPKAAVIAKLSEIQDAGYVWSLKEDGPNAVLEAETPNLPGENETDTVVSDTWELSPGYAEKDLLESDLGFINTLSDEDKRTIEDAIANPGNTPSLVGDLQKAYRLMLAKMRSVIMFAPVLRRTVTVGSAYNVQASNTYVKRVVSTATIRSSAAGGENLPSGFLITLNASPFTDVANAGRIPKCNYGWYKFPPTLNQSVGGRLQIVQEWHFGLWSEDVYLEPV